MKIKRFLLILTLFLFAFSLSAQDVIENPENPLNKKTGRIIQLKEVMRIRDIPEKDVIFKRPKYLVVDGEGDIYVCEGLHIYKFDSNGKFVFRMIKKGQGPGEIWSDVVSGISNYFVTNDEVVVCTAYPYKIMRFNLKGDFKNEIRIKVEPPPRFIGLADNEVYILEEEVPAEARRKIGYFDYQVNLSKFSLNFQEKKEIYSIQMRGYSDPEQRRFSQGRIEGTLKNNKTLFFTHTPEYQIIKFNLEENEVEKIFKRKYKRVENPRKKSDLKYLQDIDALIVVKDKIWVFTSTQDERGNRLIDVFDMDGKYIDKFYLEFPESFIYRHLPIGIIVIKGNFVFTIERDDEGYFSIVKYQMESGSIE